MIQKLENTSRPLPCLTLYMNRGRLVGLAGCLDTVEVSEANIVKELNLNWRNS